MNRKYVRAAGGGAAVAILIALLSATAAFADSRVDRARVQAVWSAHAVPQSVQVDLLARQQAGITLESEKAGARPISTTASFVGAFKEYVETFSDGSIRIAQVQYLPATILRPDDMTSRGAATADRSAGAADSTPAAGALAAGVTGCQQQSGSGYTSYTNCLIRGWSGSVTNWFYADWTIVAGSQNDQLTATRNPGQTCTWPITCTIPTRSQYVKQETGP